MQRTLVFTREERLLLIDAATLAGQAGVSATLAQRLKGLLLQLELTQGKEGCFPGQKLLAAKMGVTRFAVMRWVEQLRQLKLLRTDPRKNWAGNRQLDYHVDWQALRKFCTAEQLAEIAAKLDGSGESAGGKTSGKKCNSAPKNATAGCCTAQPPAVAGRNRPYSYSSSNLEEAILQLVEQVAACGVDQAVPAVHAALAAACSPAEIQAAIDHYRTIENRTSETRGVTPGALYVKLCKMQPGEAANRRFPKGSSIAAAGANRLLSAREATEFQQEAERSADTAAREQAERDQLEAEQGCALDALSKAERLQLLEQTGSAGLLYEFRRKPSSDLVRFELLKILRNRKRETGDGSRETGEGQLKFAREPSSLDSCLPTPSLTE